LLPGTFDLENLDNHNHVMSFKIESESELGSLNLQNVQGRNLHKILEINFKSIWFWRLSFVAVYIYMQSCCP